MLLDEAEIESVHGALPVTNVLLPNLKSAIFSIGDSDAPLSQGVVLVLISVHLDQLVSFPFKFFSDGNLLSQFRLRGFILLKYIAVSNGVEALLD